MSCTQCEAGTKPTTYIPTTTAAVGRNADDLIISGGANVSFTAGTLMAVITADSIGQVQEYSNLWADASNLMESWLSTAGKPSFRVRSGGDYKATLEATSAITAGTPTVITIVWAVDDFRQYVDGADEKADTSGAVPVGSPDIYPGRYAGGGFQVNGSVQHLCIWDNAHTAAQILQNVNWVRTKMGLL
jgi:hypothetical protein